MQVEPVEGQPPVGTITKVPAGTPAGPGQIWISQEEANEIERRGLTGMDAVKFVMRNRSRQAAVESATILHESKKLKALGSSPVAPKNEPKWLRRKHARDNSRTTG